MLRAGGAARRIARRAALGVGAASAASGVAATAYACSEQGLGFRRELQFWSVVSPIVFDYWWHAASSSPFVKYQKLVHPSTETSEEDVEVAGGETTTTTNGTAARDNKYKELHERNAPRIFHVMLDLGGLYIKLGQVLSVTALPIPDQYRDLFRTLQSSVPGHAEFEAVVKPTLEQELGKPLEEIFENVEEIPCGAASIGQAHKAILRETGEEVIIKVQYPDARWQVPADIQCVGDFMQLCVYFNLIDESASKLSYEEFSRQFLSELEYDKERQNLEEVYESSLDPSAPYIEHGVVVPRVFPELCTNQVITMTYLPGPKFEEEAKRQLEMVGISTKRSMRDVVREATKDANGTSSVNSGSVVAQNTPVILSTAAEGPTQWQLKLAQIVGKWIGVDSVLVMLRVARKLLLWSKSAAVSSINAASTLSLVPSDWEAWAKEHENAALQVARLDWTQQAVYALLDVHGYQILNRGLFNADPHPGNLLIVQDQVNQSSKPSEPKIGLIDFGQCKRLTTEERVKVAKLLLSVADNAPDDQIAGHFRDLGIQTKNDSTRFLAEFARLMFGSFKPEHLNHSWHKELHKEDRVTYFPNELSMVYRTSLLLRGLAMSLQLNVSVGEQWRHHAQSAIEKNNTIDESAVHCMH